MSYNLSSDTFGGDDSNDNDAATQESLRSGGRADDLFGKPQDFADRRLNTIEKMMKIQLQQIYTSIKSWSLRLAYAVNYNNSRRQSEISCS